MYINCSLSCLSEMIRQSSDSNNLDIIPISQSSIQSTTMHFSGFSAILAVLAAVSSASPMEKKHFSAEITFIGAAGASFTQSFIVDGSNVAISMFPGPFIPRLAGLSKG